MSSFVPSFVPISFFQSCSVCNWHLSCSVDTEINKKLTRLISFIFYYYFHIFIFRVQFLGLSVLASSTVASSASNSISSRDALTVLRGVATLRLLMSRQFFFILV
jgi:hypothetical protein